MRVDGAARPVVPRLVDGSWATFRTLVSEHHVTVEAPAPDPSPASGDGRTRRRTLRGLLAVERPGRFRLRALGPGELTLFDVLHRHGDVHVVEAIRVPGDAALPALARSIAADLALAYDLLPRPPGRSFRVEGDVVVGTEPGRAVELSGFTRHPRGGLAPTRLRITSSGGYRVDVEATTTTLDDDLDPDLFAPTPR